MNPKYMRMGMFVAESVTVFNCNLRFSRDTLATGCSLLWYETLLTQSHQCPIVQDGGAVLDVY